MSNKERCVAMLDNLDENQLVFVIDMISAYMEAEQRRREAEEAELLGPFKDFDEMMEAFRAGDQNPEIV